MSSIEAEDALADEFCEWVRSWQTVPAEGSTPERVLSWGEAGRVVGHRAYSDNVGDEQQAARREGMASG